MISSRLDAIDLQYFRQFFRSFPVQRINDATFPSVLVNKTNDSLDGLLLLDFRPDFIFKVWPVERRNKYGGVS